MTANEIDYCIRELQTVYSMDNASKWLGQPNPSLSNRKPKDCPFPAVMHLIDELKSARSSKASD